MYITNIARIRGHCKKGVGFLVSYGDLERALSLERFGRYLDWSAGDRARAIELYTLNTRISESLYTPLQMLEVALRNRIHAVMTEAWHEDWFRDEGFLLGKWQPGQLAKAIEEVREERKEPTPGRIVAALTFSFWTAMFGKDYETLWRTTLHRIGSHPDGEGLRLRPARADPHLAEPHRAPRADHRVEPAQALREDHRTDRLALPVSGRMVRGPQPLSGGVPARGNRLARRRRPGVTAAVFSWPSSPSNRPSRDRAASAVPSRSPCRRARRPRSHRLSP